MGARLRLTLGSNISGPYKLAKYTGTKGNTHGERKDNSPAPKANKGDAFSIINYGDNLILLDFNLRYQVRCQVSLLLSGDFAIMFIACIYDGWLKLA
jgi:hypothetical protein